VINVQLPVVNGQPSNPLNGQNIAGDGNANANHRHGFGLLQPHLAHSNASPMTHGHLTTHDVYAPKHAPVQGKSDGGRGVVNHIPKGTKARDQHRIHGVAATRTNSSWA
jgi:hypothetical protein